MPIILKSGKILISAGKIAISTDCCCSTVTPCATECASFPASLTAEVSGFIGDCATMNGTWTISLMSCVYIGMPAIYAYYGCTGTQWDLTIGGASGGATLLIDNVSSTPPTGTFLLIGYGICDGRIVTVTIT